MSTETERKESIERLYEDIRRAMNSLDYTRASRLSLQLYAELGEDEFVRSMGYPACLECNGYAEVVDPKHPERRTMCTSAVEACPGNLHGRMTPEAFKTYLEAKLSPLKPTLTEEVPKADAEGNVPKLPPSEQEPTKASDKASGGIPEA